ncbi:MULTISPECIES: aspartate kinase [Bacillota]|uniref:aspartate kinase n=3 Tax=Erysipelotrichaceae TaxID=128827 RepID=A0A7G9GIY4_9FIRM|nr:MULTISPECIES: aspartate kinase [Bacillota]QNM10766.1 aspartate kinase [[Eubacterium] hominis]RGB61312.1 aspartate kinase [Absiella sp. AM10-20]RGC45282.1 aspartate kinase [Absiella sp. AM29-15]MCH4285733.1 aspartate kinase [Amedibacillus hominis]RGB53928.1 aspartate kinase [Absiella sp. AM22-9]
MKIRVMKFGGTSLRNRKTRTYVYRHVIEASKTSKVLMVVSAMGRYPDAYATDTLLSLGNDHISKEESARLVSIGEQLSALTISSELQEMGIDSYSIPFCDAGIITDDTYDYARVLDLDDHMVKRRLRDYDVVVSGGFIGINDEGKVTTLGRGGSDYSAVLFADMLGLNEVEIYTDVDGVYTMDPKMHTYAMKYDQLSYDEMLNMKSRVLHDRCVTYAKEHQITIHLKGTFSCSAGTIISQ